MAMTIMLAKRQHDASPNRYLLFEKEKYLLKNNKYFSFRGKYVLYLYLSTKT